jgi:ribosomal-protein-alanine N-acetyltransferase
VNATVRRFAARDLAAVITIERACFKSHAWPPEWLTAYAADFPDLFMVASIEGRIVGYSAAALARGWAELVSVAVLPAFRGRGVASALLSATIGKLRRRGTTGLSLMVRVDNRRAQRLYTRFGFARVRIIAGYYEDGSAGLRMRLRLKGNIQPAHARQYQ